MILIFKKYQSVQSTFMGHGFSFETFSSFQLELSQPSLETKEPNSILKGVTVTVTLMY